jgi:hypothetical protein
MGEEHESADRTPAPATSGWVMNDRPAAVNPGSPASGWVMNDRPAGQSHRFGAMAALILVGLPLMAFLAYGTLHVWSAAASDCQVFDAGDRFGVVFILWPVSTFVLWFGYSLPILVLGRRSVRVGLIVGLIVVTVVALWYLAGTADMIRASSDGQTSCPTGVPDWWPTVLPH